MFWGLIMEPGRAYTQTVKVSFHVSMAALDVSNSNDEPSQIMCLFEGRNYLLCTLNKADQQQCALDLNFEAGTQISFATNGKSHVHLTGYLTSMDDDEFGQEEEEEEEEEEATPQLSKAQMKRLKKALAENGPPTKKFKGSQDIELTAEEEDSSDSDFDLNAAPEVGSDEEDDDTGSEEEQSEDEEEAEEEEDGSSSLSEEEEVPKPKQNGVEKSKKSKADEKVGVKKQNEKNKEKAGSKQQQQQKQAPTKGKKQNLPGGIIIEDLRDGTGEKVAKAGKFVHVYYEGRLKDNNKMFDSTTKGPGFSFRLGKGEVIKGWDIGVVGMKVGGKRRITCPPKVAYGAKGSPPVIPPNSTLVFDVELKKVN